MNYSLATIPDYTLYEKCKRRLKIAGYFKKVETAHEFFQGNQWGDSPPDNMPRPVVNIIEPIVSYKVSQISQNGMNLYIESEESKVQQAFADRIDKIWEKQDMDNLIYEVLLNASVSGVSAVYCYFDEENKDVVCEIKDARDIIFSCEQETDLEKQDFIMLPYRDSIVRIKAEGESLGLLPQQLEMIRKDQDDFDDIVERTTCVLKMWKENGTVHFSKFTRHVVLVEDEDTGLETYPISILPWGENAGNIRGLGEVTKILQNQIEINKNYARRGVSIMDGAYPKIAYLTDMVENPESITEVGSAIGVSGTSVADVAKAITYLSPVRISSDAEAYTSELIELTRALAGASDNSIGLVNPEAASGTAILAVQSAQQMPLSRQIAKMRKFIEKLGRVWLELYKMYLPSGFVTDKGKRISKKQIEDAIKHLKVEIYSKSPYTTTAVENALKGYLESGHITFEDYCKLLPNGGVGQMVLKNYTPPSQEEKAESAQSAIQSMLGANGSANGSAQNTATNQTVNANQMANANQGGDSQLYSKVATLAKNRWGDNSVKTNNKSSGSTAKKTNSK
ncbi:MAG: phage portal protein [Bacillota bacterium]